MVLRLTPLLVLLTAAVAHAQGDRSHPRFTLGDTRETVRQVQGKPDVIERLASLGVETWAYRDATVKFSLGDGRVVEWLDPRRSLRVTVPRASSQEDTVASLGASARVLARLMGTPWAVTRDPRGGQQYWAYGKSVVRLSIEPPAITGWIRRDERLRTNRFEDERARFGREVTSFLDPGTSSTTKPAATSGARLMVVGVRMEDQSGDGRLVPREIADVLVRLRNAGRGPSIDTRARLSLGVDLFTAAGTPPVFSLGDVAAGDSVDVTFAVYSNARARDVRLSLDVEAEGVPPTTIALPVTFDRALPHTIDDTPARADSVVPETESISTDVERYIPNAARRNPDGVAVVLGVERYRSLPAARYAARDARLLRRYAIRTFGVDDDADHLHVRSDADVTGNEMRKLFGDDGWLARRVTENTDLLVYFAGHGAADPATGRAYLLPYDADANYARETGFDLAELFDRLARLPARSITVVLDACFTGMTRSNAPLVPGTRPIVISIEHPALLRRGMAAFLASRGTQLAGDFPSMRQGLFTYFLARGLQGAADVDADHRITVQELERYLEREVSRQATRLDREQRPLTIALDTTRTIVRLAGPRR